VLNATRPACTEAANIAKEIVTATATLAQNATQLVISAQPQSASVTAGASISLTVEFQDQSNKTVAASGTVTLSMSNTGAAGATLLNARVQAVNGRAVFSNVQIEKAGLNYRLVASSANVRPAISSAFNVVSGPPAKLAFSVQPAGALVNTTWVTQPQVDVQDAFGNHVTSGAYAVTVSAPDNVNLTGTLTATTVNGVAKFVGLRIAEITSQVQLTASASGLASATSVSFAVVSATGTPFRLSFGAQPGGAIGSQPFSTQPIIQVLDASNEVVKTATNVISLKLSSSSSSDGTLSGSTTRVASGGETGYTDLSINRAGFNYSLIAESDGLVSATSSYFDVTGVASLTVTVLEATNITSQSRFSVRVEAKNTNGIVDSGFTDAIKIGIKPWTGMSGAMLSGLTEQNAVGGFVQFANLSLSTAGEGNLFSISQSIYCFRVRRYGVDRVGTVCRKPAIQCS
jgi:hypothetical protein